PTSEGEDPDCCPTVQSASLWPCIYIEYTVAVARVSTSPNERKRFMRQGGPVDLEFFIKRRLAAGRGLGSGTQRTGLGSVGPRAARKSGRGRISVETASSTPSEEGFASECQSSVTGGRIANLAVR